MKYLWVFLLSDLIKQSYRTGCVDSGGETPDPIPNSEVKPAGGEGSARAT